MASLRTFPPGQASSSLLHRGTRGALSAASAAEPLPRAVSLAAAHQVSRTGHLPSTPLSPSLSFTLRPLLPRPAVKAAVSAGNAQAVTEDDVTVAFPQTPLFVPYPAGPAAPVLLCQRSTVPELGAALAEFVAQASRDAIRERGAFTVALSGGSLADCLGALTVEPYLSQVEWSKWHVLWVDERFVKHTSPDSNFKQAAGKLLAKVPIPEDQLLPTDDEFTTLEEVAGDYEQLLRELVEDNILTTTKGAEFPRLDLILLGIGPEGHTASLFPNSPALAATSSWVLPVAESPKPPPERITMTLPVINAARQVAFVVTGQGKAEVVQRIFERSALPGSLPAQLVRPYAGSVTWFLDDSAASRLSPSDWGNSKKYPFVQSK